MNTIGTITLQNDVMWLNRILEPESLENVSYTLGQSIHVQKFAVLNRELTIGSVDDGDGLQGYFTYEQVLQLRTYARENTEVVFVYEGESITVRILESSLAGLVPLVARPNPAADDWYFGSFKAVEF